MLWPISMTIRPDKGFGLDILNSPGVDWRGSRPDQDQSQFKIRDRQGLGSRGPGAKLSSKLSQRMHRTRRAGIFGDRAFNGVVGQRPRRTTMPTEVETYCPTSTFRWGSDR